MELKAWTYEEMPDFDEDVPGAGWIETTGDETGIFYLHDVEYAGGDGRPLRLQIMIPESRNCPFDPMAEKQPFRHPCVVFVQGSAWLEQYVYAKVPQLSRLAERGYVTAIVEYRHSGITTFPGQAQDTRNAIRFLRSNADRFGIDPERMAVAGDSSGGHTALWAALLKDDGEIEKPKDDHADQGASHPADAQASHPADALASHPADTLADAYRVNQYPGVSADVKAVINYYGSVSVMGEDNYPSTVNMLQPDSPEGLVMGGVDLRERPDLRKKLSVECNINKDTELPPVLIFHGTKDRTVNTRQSAVLYRHLIDCGKEAELYFVKGADHGGPEFWTDEILNLVDEFLQKHLV